MAPHFFAVREHKLLAGFDVDAGRLVLLHLAWMF